MCKIRKCTQLKIMKMIGVRVFVHILHCVRLFCYEFLVTTHYVHIVYQAIRQWVYSEWVIERNSWFVAKKSKILCVRWSSFWNADFVPHAHTCTMVYTSKETKASEWHIKKKQHQQQETIHFIFITLAVYACVYHKSVFDNYRLYSNVTRPNDDNDENTQETKPFAQTNADGTDAFTSNHLLLRSLDFDEMILKILLEGFIAIGLEFDRFGFSCQWLLNSINLLSFRAAVSLLLNYILASIEQMISMLHEVNKHRFTASIASNLTCAFFRLH